MRYLLAFLYVYVITCVFLFPVSLAKAGLLQLHSVADLLIYFVLQKKTLAFRLLCPTYFQLRLYGSVVV